MISSLRIKAVHLDIVFSDITINALFFCEKGIVTPKGDFERASSICSDQNQNLKMMEVGSVDLKMLYFALIQNMIPTGLPMVLEDYPVAKKARRRYGIFE